MPKNIKYVCDICDITFNSRQTLWSHKQTKKHSEKFESLKKNKINKFQQVIINTINEPYYEKAQYRIQLETLINPKINFISKTPDDKSFVCTNCKKTFAKMQIYYEHIDVCIAVDNEFYDLKVLCINLTLQIKNQLNQIQNLQNELAQIKSCNSSDNKLVSVDELAKQIAINGQSITINTGVVNNIVNDSSIKNKFKQCDLMFNIVIKC